MFFKGIVDWRVRTAGAKALAPVIKRATSESLMVVLLVISLEGLQRTGDCYA
jgi:hypothetical protein